MAFQKINIAWNNKTQLTIYNRPKKKKKKKTPMNQINNQNLINTKKKKIIKRTTQLKIITQKTYETTND
jgi:hypothetical protein